MLRHKPKAGRLQRRGFAGSTKTLNAGEKGGYNG